MKKFLFIVCFPLLFALAGCDDPPVEKPENLIGREKMINMLKDIHLAEAAFYTQRLRDSLVKNSSSDAFYYSILDKYQVPDTVFEKSFIFYVNQPRDFEKMYRQVMNQINEMEQEYSGRKNDLLEIKVQEEQQ